MTIFIEEFEPTLDTHNTYLVYFFDESIRTTVTHNGSVVSDWINEIENIHDHYLLHLIVGLHVNNNSNNNVATLQICVGHRCLIYQLIHTLEIPYSLFDFLSGDSYMFAGVGINSHLEKLKGGYGIGSDTDGVDLRYLAARHYKRMDLEDAGLETLARVVLEKEIIEKPEFVTRTRWDQRSLNEDQVMYACVDAFLCFKISKLLLYAYTSNSD